MGPDRRIDLVVTSRGEALPPGVAPQETWIAAVDDAVIARSVGWSGEVLPREVPGRIGVASLGLVAQVARGAPGLADLAGRVDTTGGPAPIEELPARVGLDDLGPTEPTSDRATLIGLHVETLRPVGPDLSPGRHLLVVGRPESGVTTCLGTIATQWAGRHPHARVLRLDARSSPDAVAGAVDRAVDADARGPCLLVVDDAHRVDDERGRLDDLVSCGVGHASGDGANGVTVVAGVRADAVRSAFGHWTRAVAAGERGVALAAGGDPPTDVFGLVPPRRPIVPQRPGLGWWVDGGRMIGLQIATAGVPSRRQL